MIVADENLTLSKTLTLKQTTRDPETVERVILRVQVLFCYATAMSPSNACVCENDLCMMRVLSCLKIAPIFAGW